jgi:antitoxin YefM
MTSIKTADLTQNFKEVANRINAGEKILISRPKNENIVLITEKEYNELNISRRKLAGESLRKTMREMQEQAIVNGTANMTLEEINDLVAEAKIAYGDNNE